MTMTWDSGAGYCKETLQCYGETKKIEIITTIWTGNNRSGMEFVDCQIAFNGRDTYYECEIFKKDISIKDLDTFCMLIVTRWKEIFMKRKYFEECGGEVIYFTPNNISKCCNRVFGDHRHHIFLRQGFETHTKILKCLEGIVVGGKIESRQFDIKNDIGCFEPILNWPGSYNDAKDSAW